MFSTPSTLLEAFTLTNLQACQFEEISIESIEEKITQTENELLIQARSLSWGTEAEHEIKALAQKLRDKIKKMKQMGSFPEKILEAATLGLKEIQTYSAHFSNSCQTFGFEKENLQSQIESLRRAIPSSCQFPDFAKTDCLPKATLLDFIKVSSHTKEPQDSFWAEKQDKIKQTVNFVLQKLTFDEVPLPTVISSEDTTLQGIFKQATQPLRIFARTKVENQMKVVRLAAITLEGLEQGMILYAKGLLQDLKKVDKDLDSLLTVTSLKPILETTIEKSTHQYKQLLRAVGMTDIIRLAYIPAEQQLLSFYKKMLIPCSRGTNKTYLNITKDLSGILKTTLDIPNKRTEQFFHDCLHLGIALAPLPPVLKMGKFKITVINPKIVLQRKVKATEVGISSKILKNPNFKHTAKIKVYEDKLLFTLDWIKLPKGEFSLENYVEHLKNLAISYGVKKLEFESVFINPRFAERWKETYRENLSENFFVKSPFPVDYSPPEYCKFSFAVEKAHPKALKAALPKSKVAPFLGAPLPNDLIAHRINRIASDYLYFPSVSEIQTLSVPELHRIWMQNTETLIGLVANEKISYFGLHTTNKRGLISISESKYTFSEGREALISASFRHYLDPITKLSDIYAMIAKSARNEKTEGRTLILCTAEAASFDKPIYFNPPEKWLLQDNPIQTDFTALIGRQAPLRDLYDIKMHDSTLIKTKDIVNADEFLVHLNPNNYHNIVKGIVQAQETLYPSNLLHPAKLTQSHASDKLKKMKTLLTTHFKWQERALHVFEKLGVPPDLKVTPWQNYQKTGRELLENMDEITTFSKEELVEIYRVSFGKRIT